ncbi:MAG: cation-translocating P-type ATPase [Acidimicrobiia bacterium]
MDTTSTLDPAERVIVDAYRLDGQAVVAALDTDAASGLSAVEARRRHELIGPNELAEATPVPRWRQFLGQFTDRLILILLAAAVVALVVSRELKTPLVVLAVLLLNGVIGFIQEQRAERSLEALRRMVVASARVRRGGSTLVVVPAAELVPGDVVLIEAGDRVPADGRLLVAIGLEIDEAALTGESQPAVKSVARREEAALPVGDRSSMAYLNTIVTRGRAELIVTAIGMATEVGRIAALLRATAVEKTPLQRQLDRLAHSLAKLAALVVAAVAVIGLVRGHPLEDVLLTAVALAVAAIPEGLPAVTAVTLAVGVSKMARRNAIVKRLASVETLGCTSVICSDKTGTLTLNEMTAVELVVGARSFAVTGSGYRPQGLIGVDAESSTVMLPVLRAMALCNDAVVHHDGDDWRVVGDPTEGALVVAAVKGGVDIDALRAAHPRVAEFPFDSAHKLMATAHLVERSSGSTYVEVIVKGAPDVLVARATSGLDGTGHVRPIAELSDGLVATIDMMATRGLRVLAVAERHVAASPAALSSVGANGGLTELIGELTLLGLVGIVDPARPEAAQAIAEAHDAGLAVKMITGDHAATASAIAAQLGLSGGVITGAELDRLGDDELAHRIDGVAVFARVSPDHKLRLVDALQRRGAVVAMTGDGVNDAPALKKADIGVAMGITGTEVTKEAATMILADDNFATIVGAVRRGRTIYDNIITFVRFQLSTTVGFALLFLLAGAFGVAGGQPFTAIAILWVNLVMDGPPAMALGFDPPHRDVMSRRPRPVDEPILTRPRKIAIASSAVVMATGTLAVLAWAPGPEPGEGTATIAGTMALSTFVLFQFFNIFNTRSDRASAFRRDSLRNIWLWASLAGVLTLQVAVVHVGPLQALFDTTSLTLWQWAVCALVASSVLWIDELRKLITRHVHKENTTS